MTDNGLIYYQVTTNVSLKTIEKSLADGASPNSRGGYPVQTALAYAVMHRPNLVEILIGYGAKVEWKSGWNSETALMIALAEKADIEIIKDLIRGSVDINTPNRYGENALVYAIKYSNLEIIKALLYKGAKVSDKVLRCAINRNNGDEILNILTDTAININERNKNNETALIYAVENSNLKIVTMLLNKGVKPDTKNRMGMSALMYAARNNNSEITEILIKAGADIDAENNNGETALMYAARYNNNSKTIETLIQAGADINAKNNNGETALMYAVRYNKNQEIIKVLIEAGTDIEAENNDRETALMYAAKYNAKLEKIGLLLKNKANIDAKNNNGKTALMYAVNSFNMDIVKILLLWGADTAIKNNEDQTVLQLTNNLQLKNLLEEKNYTIEFNASQIKEFTPKDINNYIISLPDINIKDKDGKTLLIHTAKNNINPKVIEILVKSGADIFAKDNTGKTALIYAAQYNANSKIIDILSEAGADITEKDNFGKSCLYYLQENNNIQKYVAKYKNTLQKFCISFDEKEIENLDIQSINNFIDNLPDINVQDEQGMTFLMHALMLHKSPEIIMTVLQRGANVELKDHIGQTALDIAEEYENSTQIINMLKARARK